MAAYNAQIGVAVAAYFPTIALTASVGFESYSLSTLTNPLNNIWGVGFSLFQTIFNAGRTGLNVERSRAAYQERVALYQALLLKVFQEVETARDRFLLEAVALINLKHPNLVEAFLIHRYEGFTSYTMEFLEGAVSVEQRLRTHGPLDATESTRIIRAVASALAAIASVGPAREPRRNSPSGPAWGVRPRRCRA